MDFVDVARTTFAAREFTDEPVPDDVLYRIFDTARFAPNGGNRQGWKVIAVRDRETKKALGELCWGPMRVAAAQTRAGGPPTGGRRTLRGTRGCRPTSRTSS